VSENTLTEFAGGSWLAYPKRELDRKAYVGDFVADCFACRCFPACLADLPKLRMGPQ
jgi:hypothetical protein